MLRRGSTARPIPAAQPGKPAVARLLSWWFSISAQETKCAPSNAEEAVARSALEKSHDSASATHVFHLARRRTMALYGRVPQEVSCAGGVFEGHSAPDRRCSERGAGGL